MARRRKRKTERLKPVSKLADLADNGGEFNHVRYGGVSGCQPGAWVSLIKGNLEALLKVERELLEKGIGYGATETTGSRIGYLTIHTIGGENIFYGTWDPNELSRTPKHNFDKDPKPVRDFAELIVKYFSK